MFHFHNRGHVIAVAYMTEIFSASALAWNKTDVNY